MKIEIKMSKFSTYLQIAVHNQITAHLVPLDLLEPPAKTDSLVNLENQERMEQQHLEVTMNSKVLASHALLVLPDPRDPMVLQAHQDQMETLERLATQECLVLPDHLEQ